MSEVKCPHCGGTNESSAAFCGTCGTPIAVQASQSPAAPPQAWQPPAPGQPPPGAYPPLPPGAIPVPPGVYPPPPGVYQEYPGANFVGQLPIAHPGQAKKPLVSRTTWIVCSIVSVLMALSNASSNGATGADVFIPYVLGGFVGALLLLVGCCAGVTFIYRAISGKQHTVA